MEDTATAHGFPDESLADRISALAHELEAGNQVPVGKLLGLPELPDGDVWVDMAGASALGDCPPTTITSWLTRGGPK